MYKVKELGISNVSLSHLEIAMHSDCVTDGRLVPDGMINQGTQMPVLMLLGIGYP